ncbi:bifunctional folylpolyglutamate synthase/dihydrofolate synthase [candidate division KSB1 bacterium]|nr:bifunctional folylpolyglutamate synthase/dihydrofolate synthase [candidate division KSB1 bacterium]
MTYQDATDYLFNLERFGIKLGLDRMTSFLEAIGNPQAQFKAIHVAGTNGKGSTCAILESILRQSGAKTGLYTSPHLVRAEERIKINGVPIDTADFLNYVVQFQPLIDKFRMTFFESLTAIAFHYFAQHQIDIAVLEVGLGGRLDATNVVTPQQTLITSISYDHQLVLGRSLEQIAGEKAGILKPGVPCFTNNNDPLIVNIIKQKCDSLGCQFFPVWELVEIGSAVFAPESSRFDLKIGSQLFTQLEIPLAGRIQLDNAALAVFSAFNLDPHCCAVTPESIYKGLRTVNWHGRLQLIKDVPRVLVDVAHNSGGMSVFVSNLKDIYEYNRLICILGVMEDKDCASMLKTLSTVADTLIAVAPQYKRALPAEEIARTAAPFFREVVTIPRINEAFAYALSRTSVRDLLCIVGSHFTVGELLSPENRKQFGFNIFL